MNNSYPQTVLLNYVGFFELEKNNLYKDQYYQAPKYLQTLIKIILWGKLKNHLVSPVI